MPTCPPIRRAAAAATLLLAAAATSPASAQALSYIGQQILPAGTSFGGTLVGGLSGIDFDPSTGRYIAISDDRSQAAPARYYGLSLDLTQFVRSATPGSAGVALQSVTTILAPGGGAHAPDTVDPESIRINPLTGAIAWSNEGQRGGAGSPSLQNPTVREMTAAGGVHLRDYAVPSRYEPVGSAPPAPGDRGIRNNLAFESLTFSPDGSTLYTATENALVADGPPATPTDASPARILAFDTLTGNAGAEYAYLVDPSPAGAVSVNGLSELLAIGDRQFVAVERSFSTAAGPGGGFGIRLYLADARTATDVSGFDLGGATPYAAVAKTLLLDLSTLTQADGTPLALDNIEGITRGPDFDGRPTLVLVSDDNFSGAQVTQFVALSLTAPIPEPATALLLATGLAGLAFAVRQRRRRPVA